MFLANLFLNSVGNSKYFVLLCPMIDIKGYKQVAYNDLQKALKSAFDASEKSHIQLAADIKCQSLQTARNVFLLDKQVVSDVLLTQAMKAVSLSGFVIWIFGARYYYIKTK